MDKYLDITKNVIISSPAGSGKTEKLARRYINLLINGSEIEKILCITFTEKAAAEMKERILSILEKENPETFNKIKDKMPLMRISTIHAFCLKLLKRFSMEIGLDPSLDVMDEFNASLLWAESVYECLLKEKNKPDIFFDMMKEKGIKGWDRLYEILNTLYKKRPVSELLLNTDLSIENNDEKRILQLYSRCIDIYRNKKLDRHLLDFNDLELMTYNTLIKHPEWQNILYTFDEHTDHILVDEFQDTSTLQWKIIDKLTEEWRSGIGAKRDRGKTPTIFLVGDDKQSIYLFRGANVSVFHEAKERLSAWLGKEYHFEEVRENFRSLPAIINFTNNLFEKLMPPTFHESWRTRYAPFEATRRGQGRVELLLIDAEKITKKSRAKEAMILSKRIRSLVNSYEIFDGDIKRPCTYGDMAILLKRRTHLCLFENALRKEHIPFVTVKGIGFYDESEVALLREMLSFVIDPLDDYSLFCILRSPIFGIDYRTLLRLMDKDEQPLIEKLCHEPEASEISKILNDWIERARNMPLATLLEEAITETGGWRYFWEKQRHANIKKFIKIIESYESSGLSGIEIREKLIRARDGNEEPKANVNTEGMNAVKIMTIHAAKGLQFPMVFLPSLDERHTSKSNSVVIDEEDGHISIAYEEDPDKREKTELFQRRKEKEIEEEKRLFYVAVTRARDFLCMLGAVNKDKPPTGRLLYLTENFDITMDRKADNKTDFLEIITESEINRLCPAIEPPAFCPKPPTSELVYTAPISFDPATKWRDVTEDLDIRIKHGEDWVLLGRIFHKLFEELSKGILSQDRIQERTNMLLKNEFLSDDNVQRLSEIIQKDFQELQASGYLDNIILQRDNSFAEMPFVLQKGNTVFEGRIDRIIIDNNTALIYDYKTFPVKDSELPELVEKYKFQLDIYREAASKILSLKTKSYLLFTHRPMLVES